MYIGCRGCAMACKSFNQLEPERFWRYVYPLDREIYPHEERAFTHWHVTTVSIRLASLHAR
jgi:Fe-S-cluster-containing dehydrogenase component